MPRTFLWCRVISFRELLASGGSAFLVMDPQGRIQQGCPLFSHWLGYDSPDALVGQSLGSLVHPQSTVGADHLLVSHT